MNKNTPKLSFCITCKNRFSQISKTLPKNLEDNFMHKDSIEFVLVDFGSTDGLQQWIEENFIDYINSGYLKYYYTDELKYWHASIAKNTAHILAINDIVVNLDCDNFTGKNGGWFVIENMIKYGPGNIILHQFSNEFGDGSYGRIGMLKSNFLRVGGYDENFDPMGYQDTDIILRLRVLGCDCICLSDKEYNQTIPNSKELSMKNVDSKEKWQQMNLNNFKKSTQNITSGSLIANKNKTHIGVVKNMYTLERDDAK